MAYLAQINPPRVVGRFADEAEAKAAQSANHQVVCSEANFEELGDEWLEAACKYHKAREVSARALAGALAPVQFKGYKPKMEDTIGVWLQQEESRDTIIRRLIEQYDYTGNSAQQLYASAYRKLYGRQYKRRNDVGTKRKTTD
jgi:hypothetical protein